MWPFPKRETKAATMRATLASPDDEMIALLTGGGGVGTASGESVGPLSALRVPAVLAAVRSIAETAGSLDVRVMRISANGVPVEDASHPANAILQHPNPWTGRYAFIRGLCFDACRHGVGYAVAARARGEVRELIRVRPGSLVCDLDLDTAEPAYRYGDRNYSWADVVHVQPIPSDNGELSSLVQLAREGIGFASVLQRHGAQLFANQAKPGGILSVKPAAGANAVAPATLKNVKEVWERTFGFGKSGKTAALPADVTYQSLALNSVDAQYLDLWKLAILEVARAFRVPPQFLQDLERTTHSNAEELSLQFVAFCIKPWCDMLSEALERVLFTEAERGTFFIEFDFTDLVRPNMLQLFDALTKATAGAAILSPNDARQFVGKPPVEGGEKLFVPLNARPGDQSQPEAARAPGAQS